MHPRLKYFTCDTIDDRPSYDIFGYVSSHFFSYLKADKKSFRRVVNGLKNILYCFRSSLCNSLLS